MRALSPRARGRFIHELLQRFFEAWDRGEGAITLERLDARALYSPSRQSRCWRGCRRATRRSSARVCSVPPLPSASSTSCWLWRLAAGDGARALARVPARRRVLARWRGSGACRFGAWPTASTCSPATACASSTTSRASAGTQRALQVPVYALCAQERLDGTRRRHLGVDEGRLRRRLPASARWCVRPTLVTGDCWRRARERLLGSSIGSTPASFRPVPTIRDLPLLRVSVGVPEGLRRR